MNNTKTNQPILNWFQSNCFIYLFLTATILILYSQTMDFQFITFDDPEYVTENSHMQEGMSLKGLKWAFHFSDRGDKTYYHPLTWLSHMLDIQLYGLNPAGHHLTNLLIHLINSLFLFYLFKKITKTHWRSAFIAALFALHPISVDSVAWVAERKNVLSTFFYFLSIFLYTHYLSRPSRYRYLSIFLCMLIGLMAKPFLVTLPFIFLMMDIWPLARIKKITYLLYEKIPFLILSFFWVALSSLSIKNLGLELTTDIVPFNLRLANAAVSYVKYLYKALWPFNLAIFYPYPEAMPPLWEIIGAVLLLLFVSMYSILHLKKNPWLAFGWLWFTGTLFPAIGLMQNGLWPEMADRWAYIPFIGIYVILAWGLNRLYNKFLIKKAIITPVCLFFLLLLMAITWNQCRYWRDDITLFSHALQVTKNNIVAHDNLAIALKKQKKTDEAFKHLDASLQIRPNNVIALFALGNLYDSKAKYEEAANQYLKILKINPYDSKTYNNLGNVTKKQGKISDSINYYRKAIETDPGNTIAYHNLGAIFFEQNQIKQAIAIYQHAIEIESDFPELHNSMGIALEKINDLDEAIKHYQKALEIKPDLVEAHNNLGSALLKIHKKNEALSHFAKALQIDVNNPKTHNNMGMVLVALGNPQKAHAHYNTAIRLEPTFAEAYNNLGVLLYQEGDIKAAIENFKKALNEMPDDKNFCSNFNVAYSKVNDAIQSVKNKLNNDSENPVLYFQLGKLYDKIGEEQSAINQYQKALSLKSDFKQAKDALAQIRKEK